MISQVKRDAIDSGLLALVGNLGGKLISLPVGIYVAARLGTEGYGILSIILVVVQYLSYVNLGMLANLMREVPMAYGRGDHAEVRRIYSTVLTNYGIATLLGLVLFWALFAAGMDLGGVMTSEHALAITVIVVAGNADSYFYTLMKGEGKFVLFGQYELVRPVLLPLANLVLVYLFGLMGMLASHVASHLIGLAFILWRIPLPPVTLRFDLQKTVLLFRTGFFMYVNKIIDGVFTSVGVIMAGRLLNLAEVGVLGFALGVANAGKVPFATIFTVAAHRQMAVEAGRLEVFDGKALVRFFGAPYRIYLLLIGTVLGGVVLAYSVAVPVFLPEYAGSIPLIRILFFASIFYSARIFLNSYIDISGQMTRRTWILGVGIVVNVALCALAASLGYGLMGIGVAVGLSMILISVQTVQLVFGQVYRERNVSHVFLLQILILAVVLTGVLYLLGSGPGGAVPTRPADPSGWLALAWRLGWRGAAYGVFSYFAFVVVFRAHNLHLESLKVGRYALSRLGVGPVAASASKP